MARPADAGAVNARPDSASNLRHFDRARLLWQRDELDAADRLLCQILADQPAHIDAATLRAQLLQSQGRLEAATAVMASLCRHARLDAAGTLRCIQFVRQCQRQPLAARLCEQAFDRGVRSADLLALSGLIYRELGEFAAARKQFYSALDAGVDLNTWFVPGALAATLCYQDAKHPDFERLRTQFHNADLSVRARAASGFGLAKGYDDVGDYARAAETLRSANWHARAVQPWQRAGWDEWVTERVRRTRAVPAMTRGAGDDFAPVFVVGLPRSGTTLTALQLGRNADIRLRGELPHIPYIAARLANSGRGDDPAALGEAAALYAAHMRQDDGPARWHVDSNQMNFRYLDLIARMFPQARVIHCVREPRDTALSMWSQFFAHDDCAFANDWDDIAAFCAGHDRLMRHWVQRLDLPLHTVVYEDLIADPARVRAGLNRFIGMEAVDAAYDAGQPATAITSASLWQARQPIHRASAGRWKRYAPFVAELATLIERT